jgi:DNA-binding transcriptional regulator GbsR (MarR family)
MSGRVEKFIERFGVFWEEDGLPRIAGRIYALTLITEEPLSLDEIATRLGVSKASVSNDTRLLERMGFIERLSLPGDRRDYYQSTERSFERAIGERIRRMSHIEALLESGQTLVADNAAVRARLDDHHFAFRHVRQALETALDALREKHERETPDAGQEKKTRKS